MARHLASMRAKGRRALALICTAADVAGLNWDDFARVVPQRVEAKACYGAELTIVPAQVPGKLNSLQREWGRALVGLYPGMPGYMEVAGWKLLVELGWGARL